MVNESSESTVSEAADGCSDSSGVTEESIDDVFANIIQNKKTSPQASISCSSQTCEFSPEDVNNNFDNNTLTYNTVSSKSVCSSTRSSLETSSISVDYAENHRATRSEINAFENVKEDNLERMSPDPVILSTDDVGCAKNCTEANICWSTDNNEIIYNSPTYRIQEVDENNEKSPTIDSLCNFSPQPALSKSVRAAVNPVAIKLKCDTKTTGTNETTDTDEELKDDSDDYSFSDTQQLSLSLRAKATPIPLKALMPMKEHEFEKENKKK